jgi:hypothetical protein
MLKVKLFSFTVVQQKLWFCFDRLGLCRFEWVLEYLAL